MSRLPLGARPRRPGRADRSILGIALALLALTGQALPQQDRDDHQGDHRDERRDDHRDDHRDERREEGRRGHSGYHQRGGDHREDHRPMYRDPYGYAQPLWVPPPVYREPVPSPGITLFFPLDLRH